MNLKNIYNGYKNIFIKNEAVEKIAKKRLKICIKCPEYVKNKMTEILLKTFILKKIKTNICNNCKCPIVAKIRSVESKCPLKKW